jgi:hypothetical protein
MQGRKKHKKVVARKTPLSELERWLISKIGHRPVGTPFALWVKKLEPFADPSTVQEAIDLHNRLRYDPADPEPTLTERLQQLCQSLRSQAR